MGTNTNSPRLLSVIAALAVVYFVWGSTYLALKYAVTGLPPFMLVGLRNLLAGAILLPLAWRSLRRTHGFRIERAHLRAAVFIGLMLIVGGNGSVTYAQSHGVPSAVAALIVGLVPSWMTVFTFLTNKGSFPGRRSVILRGSGLLAGLIGLAVLVADGALSTNGGTWLMTGILVLGTVTWAYGSVRAKYIKAHPDLLAATTLSMLVGGVIALAVGAGLGELPQLLAVQRERITGSALVAFAYLVVFGSVVGYSVYGWLLKHADPGLTGTYAYVNPLVAMALGYFVGGEEIGPSVLIAGGLIIVSVILITLASRSAAASRQKCAEVCVTGETLPAPKKVTVA